MRVLAIFKMALPPRTTRKRLLDSRERRNVKRHGRIFCGCIPSEPVRSGAGFLFANMYPTGAFAGCRQSVFTPRRASTKPLEVDLGYATYRGEYNEKTGLNTWLG